jgi:DNA topoisomerase-1
VRCTNYENCKTSYPLPQQGDLEPTEERCECGTPKVIVHTKKGPWKICIDPACPLKATKPSAPRKASGARKPAARKKATGSRAASPAKKPRDAK